MTRTSGYVKMDCLMGDWRSGSAGALHAQGRGFEPLIAHHACTTASDDSEAVLRFMLGLWLWPLCFGCTPDAFDASHTL